MLSVFHNFNIQKIYVEIRQQLGEISCSPTRSHNLSCSGNKQFLTVNATWIFQYMHIWIMSRHNTWQTLINLATSSSASGDAHNSVDLLGGLTVSSSWQYILLCCLGRLQIILGSSSVSWLTMGGVEAIAAGQRDYVYTGDEIWLLSSDVCWADGTALNGHRSTSDAANG